MYVKVNDGKGTEYSVSQLKADNANVSFPKDIDNDLLAAFDVYPAVSGEAPTYDPATQNLTRSAEATLVDGVWTFAYSVDDKTAQQKTDYVTALAADVRNRRDNLLAATDWRAGSDLTLSDEWKTYRQALRDVPAQSGFPNSITWPTEPS